MKRFLPLIPFCLGLVACGGHDDASVGLGQAQVSVPLAIADITQVTATISAPDITPSIVGDLAIVDDKASALFAGVPAGTARNVVVDAYVGADLVCTGATTVDVLEGAKVTVHIVLQCEVFVARGEVEILGDFNFVPVIESVVAAPSTVPVGGIVDLAVTAHDQDGDPLTYLWTATDGTFSDPSLPVTQWTAPATAGSYQIEIEVSDGDAVVIIIIIIIVIIV